MNNQFEKRFKFESDEVLYINKKLESFNKSDITKLKALAVKKKLKKIRVCFHKNKNSITQEMLILHSKLYFVKPHKHILRDESLEIIEGKADLIIFDNKGKELKKIKLGNYNSNDTFYYYINKKTYHTIDIKSKWLFFREVKQGPFLKKDTVFLYDKI